jgi:hypothetical protein
MFVMDGNFSAEHMKMRKQGDDAPMTNGTGFMVETSRYSEHLQVAKSNTEVVHDQSSHLAHISEMCLQ